MITNERQYKITRSEAARFDNAIKSFDELAYIKKGWDPLLVKAQLDALRSQLNELTDQIKQYEDLKSGEITSFSANTISEIGNRLVDARIAQGLSQKMLAHRLGMREQQVQRYEQDRYQSASLSRLSEVSEALGITFHLSLELPRTTEPAFKTASGFDFDLSKLPFNEMRKRGWLGDGSPSKQVDQKELVKIFMMPAYQHGIPALLRSGERVGREIDEYALLAWKTRIAWKARTQNVQRNFSKEDLSWVNTLREFTLREDGPALAVEYLGTKGITVVFEGHLPKTYLDGAALLVDGTPTIALTLRYDRLDNFWFVLLHELGHTLLHRDAGLVEGFFDDDSIAASDKVEREADAFAKSVFIPEERWNSSLVRFTQSADQILQFAKDNRLSPAIVAGWIRRDRNDYTIFNELVGNGKVRKALKKAGLLEGSNVANL